MSFDATLTMTGLCLLITDHPTTPSAAEVLIVNTSNMTDMRKDHRHFPVMAFLYDSRGTLGNDTRPKLPGWEEYVVGPDGNAITRVSLENTLVHIRAETKTTASFVRDGSMAKVPDLGLLGVTAVAPPGQDSRINNVTSRIALPPGTLSTTGDVVDELGPLNWDGVGVIAEFIHLQLSALSKLTVDYGVNSFSLEPIDGKVELSISNEPTTVPDPRIDPVRNLAISPHFDMFRLVANHRPELAHQLRQATPGNPACPSASWVQANWPFLS